MPDDEQFWLANPVAVGLFITSRLNEPRDYGPHEGLDLVAIDGQGRPVAVFAAQRGFVERVVISNEGYGKHVRLRHDWSDGSTYYTWYGHMSEIIVKKGDFVSIGQRLGTSGTTGNSTGIHLHLTLQHIGHGKKGYWLPDIVDPEPLLRTGPVQPRKEAQFVSDETVPDGMLIQPGTVFEKKWRLVNSGSVRWKPGFQLAFQDGAQMEGPESVPLPEADPGQQVVVSVPLKAPTTPGRQRGSWRPRDADGDSFDFSVWVEVVVAGQVSQDNARFLADVTIPDNTIIQPGQTFLKTWRVQNNGTTTWDTGYRLAYFLDNKMDAPENVEVPRTPSGQEAEISVTLKAPPQRGIYRSTWKLRNQVGQDFGEVLFALIKVEGEPIAGGRDELTLVSDVTFADATRVKPGQPLEKIWRVRNSGDNPWAPGYELSFFSGEIMAGPETIALQQLDVGAIADIGVNLVAPATEGVHRGSWKPRNAQGQSFDNALDIEIEVVPTVSPGDKVDDSAFVADLSILDGTSIQAGQSFLKSWRLRNTGSTTWGSGYELAFFKDEQLSALTSVSLPVVEPGQVADLSVNMIAPLIPGDHISTWKLRNARGEFFGHILTAVIRVPSPQQPAAVNRARFVGHESINLGTLMKPGQQFRKGWFVRNTGATTWGDGYTLTFIDGIQMGGPDSIPVPVTDPQAVARLKGGFTAPQSPGIYKGFWKLRDPSGNLFGPRLTIWIKVKP
jgi:hypothetical protein